MAYATQKDVEALNPKRSYGAETNPSALELVTLLTSIANEIDSILGAQDYTVPVTSPAYFLEHLAFINALGAGALAEGGMFPETTEKGETPHSGWLLSLYTKRLDALRKGEVPHDLARGDEGLQVSGYAVEQTDYDTYPDPIFRKESSDLEF